MATVPVAIRYLAEKDASVDRIAAEVRKQLSEVGKISLATADSGNSLAQIKNLGSELEKIRQLSGGPPIREWVQEEIGARQTAGALAQTSEQAQRLAGLGQQLGVGLSVVGAGLLGSAAYAIKAAGDFEQLAAKLQSVKGSAGEAAKTFEFARSLAASTPFDVKGVVSASVILESYKQRAESTLPAVANLAAAMGKSIEEAALVVGKATSGSAEGFESLRNTYGITTAELAKFGAKVNETGGILTRTPSQAEAARQALLAIIQTRFGDAVERQANTFQGAMSNLGDSVQNAAARLGQSLLPIATGTARALSGIIDQASKAPAALQALAAGSVVLAGALAATAGAATLAVAGLLAVNAQLSLAAGENAAAAAAYGLTSRALGALSAGATTLATSFGSAGAAAARLGSFLLATPAGLVITTLGALNAATLAYENYSKQAAKALADESHEVAKLNQGYRELLGTLNEAGKAQGVSVDFGDFRNQAEQLNSAFSKLSAQDLARSFLNSGKTAADLRGQLEQVQGASADLRTKMDAVRQAIEGLPDPMNNAKSSALLVAAGLGNVSFTSDGLKAKLAELNAEYQKLGTSQTILRNVLEALGSFTEPLERVVKDSKALNEFLDFSKRVGSAQALAAAIREVEGAIARTGKVKGLEGTAEQLTQRLLDPKLDEAQRQAIKVRLSYMDTLKGLEDKQAQDAKKASEETKKAEEDKFKAEDLAFRRRKALHQANLDDEIAFVRERLSRLKVGSEAEVKERERLAELLDKKDKGQVAAAKQSLQEQFAAAKAVAEQVKAQAGTTSAEGAKAMDGVLDRLRAWAQANQPILAQSKELRDLLQGFERSTGLEKARELARGPAEALQALKEQIAELQVDALTTAEKLAANEQATVLARKAQKAGLVDQVQAQKELTSLARAHGQLLREQESERKARAQELRQQELSAQDATIRNLEVRKHAGEGKADNGQDINQALKQARDARLKSALEGIRLQQDAEIEAARGNQEAIADIRKKYANEAAATVRDEVDRVYQERVRETELVNAELEKQASARKRSREDRTKDPQLGSRIQVSALPDFGEGFGESFYRKQEKAPPSYASVARQVRTRAGLGTVEMARQVVEQTRLQADQVRNSSATLQKRTFGTPAQVAGADPALRATTQNITNYISVSGRAEKFDASPEFSRAVKHEMDQRERERGRSPSKRKGL